MKINKLPWEPTGVREFHYHAILLMSIITPLSPATNWTGHNELDPYRSRISCNILTLPTKKHIILVNPSK